MRFDRRISRRSFLAAAGATSAVLALTACGGSSSSVAASSASGTASSAAGTAQGGTLNIMLETEVQSLDPQVATDGTSFEVIADYTDGLMQMDADGAAVPAIAETYDISEDGKTYTFHLRDAKWSNGEAVTAADFVFGWQRAVDPATASEYSYMLSDIGQVAIAVAFFVGFKGLYGSIEKTVEKYVNESVNYERLIIFDNVEDLESIASVNSKLEELKGENGKYSVALTEVFSDDEKEFALTLTGVDRSYFEMQRFYMMRDTDQETIFANGSSPRVIFPVKEADSRKFAIGDHVDCYTKDGKNIGFDVSAYYKPINLKQAFTSRESLSRALYGRDDAYNAIFLRGFTTEAEAELLANFKDIKYDVFNMQQIAQESVDKAVNGTEMIEILIYTGMFLVTALVINMFILSIGDRKKQYRQLKMLGEKNGIILKSIMLESGMIYVLGALIGILTAIPAIKIALIMIKEELVFDTVMYVPLPVTAAVSLCMLAVIMAASLMIGRKCTKAKD